METKNIFCVEYSMCFGLFCWSVAAGIENSAQVSVKRSVLEWFFPLDDLEIF